MYMGTQHSSRVSFHIDPDRLRRLRLRKQWTQRDLAQITGFCEDYISQLERASTTRNKGTKLETLMKFAQQLGVLPSDLLAESALRRQEVDIRLHAICSNVDMIKLLHSTPSTGAVMEKLGILRIDPDKLREARLRKQWTQREVARASGYSEDYISQLERAAITRNKGTRLGTILRLAQVLEIIPVDLLIEHLSEALRADMTRSELSGNTTNCGIVGLLCGKVPSKFRHTALASPIFLELLPEPVEMVTELRHKAYHLSSQALWLQAEEIGLQARSQCREGSEEWAEITLSHCAQVRQQAGDILQAQAHIEHVIQKYTSATAKPDNRILGLIDLQRGWIASEQSGEFEQGYHYFTSAFQKALQVGDAETERTARHFRLRILSELAMRAGGAWLGARPIRSIPQQLLRLLHQSVEIDWPLSCNNNPEHLHFVKIREKENLYIFSCLRTCPLAQKTAIL